jgi:hypothetical protein
MTTTEIRIPKRLRFWEDLVIELRELIEKAKKHGESEADLDTTVFEDVLIKNEKQYERYLHKEIPLLLRDILRFLRFRSITVYHRKDDIPGAEYLIQAVRGQSTYAFALDVSYDDIGGRWEILWVRVTKDAEVNKDYLPYYHEV